MCIRNYHAIVFIPCVGAQIALEPCRRQAVHFFHGEMSFTNLYFIEINPVTISNCTILGWQNKLASDIKNFSRWSAVTNIDG